MRRSLLHLAVLGAFTATTLSAQQPAAPPPPAPDAPAAPHGHFKPGMRAHGMMMRGHGMAMRMMGPHMDPASFLLARTGELGLNDAQVTRLAAVARRATAERKALRATIDSLHQSFRGISHDSAGRAEMAQRMSQMRGVFTKVRSEMDANRRDAITVLTPDQQGKAWGMVARAHAMGGRPERIRRVEITRRTDGRPGKGGMQMRMHVTHGAQLRAPRD